MKYDQPELQMRLAAEYVLGTLQGPARTRFERLLAQDQALRLRVAAWEQRLGPWASAIKPLPAPPHVWEAVRRRLGHAGATADGGARWWQWWAWGSTALAALFAVVLVTRSVTPPAAPAFRDLAVLASDVKEPGWIVRVNGNRTALQLSGLNVASPPAGKALELWSIPVKGAPMSLGVIPVQQGHALLALNPVQQGRLRQAAVLAISLEPAGGSPTGLPTGPVLYTGKPVST